MKHLSLRIMMCATILALVMAACSSPARVAPPDIVNTWRPPEGTEATSPLSCEEIGNLFAYDATAPLDIQKEKRWRDDGVTFTDFNYASPRGGRVPATLIVPDGTGPFAGMVFMHGSGGNRRSVLWLAQAYARLGAVAITISGPSNRPGHDNFREFVFREQDRREQIQLIIDLRRAVDILVARPDVDPQRLAYLGISYGGAMGGLMAAVEDRLQGYVLQVGDGGLVTHFTGSMIMGLPEAVRREWLAAMWPIEPIHYVGCAAPAALLFQSGTLDTSVPPADALRYQQAGSEPKTIRWYKAGHGLSVAAYQDQAEWLRGVIGIASYRMAFPSSLMFPLTAWFLLIAGSLIFLARDLWHRQLVPGGGRLLWLLTTVFLGPLGLAAYWISGRQSSEAGKSAVLISPVRRALGSAAWAAARNLSGAIVVLGLLLYLPQVFSSSPVLNIATIILVPFCSGWLIFAASRWFSRSDGRFSAAYRHPVFAEVVSTCLILAGAYPTVSSVLDRFFARWTAPFGFDLTYAPLWGCLSLAALVGTVVVYPLHLWLIRRGVICWGGAAESSEDVARKLTRVQQVAVFLLAVAVMLAAIFLPLWIA